MIASYPRYAARAHPFTLKGRPRTRRNQNEVRVVQRLEKLCGHDRVTPALRTLDHPALAGIFRSREQFGMGNGVFHRLDVGMRIGDVLRDVPAGLRPLDDPRANRPDAPFCQAVGIGGAPRTRIAFRNKVRLTLLDHGRDRRYGVASDHLDVAAVAMGQDELVDIGMRLGRLPAEHRHRDVAAFGMGCGAQKDGRGGNQERLQVTSPCGG